MSFRKAKIYIEQTIEQQIALDIVSLRFVQNDCRNEPSPTRGCGTLNGMVRLCTSSSGNKYVGLGAECISYEKVEFPGLVSSKS
jgi:hypothetical protein